MLLRSLRPAIYINVCIRTVRTTYSSLSDYHLIAPQPDPCLLRECVDYFLQLDICLHGADDSVLNEC